MSEHESNEPVTGPDPKLSPSGDPHDVTGAGPVIDPLSGEEHDAEPEPWTPAKVNEWNAYYDKYVLLGALFLIFVVSANRVTNSSLWTHLKTGTLILADRAPVTSNVYSYTEPEARWVNVPWLFQLGHAALYQAVYDFVPTDAADPTASQAKAEQISIGVLVALNALARLLTAFLLIKARRPGPGLWWAAICAVVALGAVWGPAGIMLGGIAHQGSVAPSTWGSLLLATEVYLLHRALNLGHRSALYGLIPLFLVWANLDDSFFFGLVILGATAVGLVLDGRESAETAALTKAKARPSTDQLTASNGQPVNASLVGIVLAISAVVCLANPSFFRVYSAALGPIGRVFTASGDIQTPDQVSFLNKTLRASLGPDWTTLAAYYGVIAALGLGSFFLNRDGFRWSRLLPYLAAVVFPFVLLRYVPEFAVLLATALVLNGQEWYQSKLGTEGKLGAGWTAWSTGGRLVTLTLIFLMVGKAITGFNNSEFDPVFGFGFRPDDFTFDAADALNKPDLKGNVFNTTLGQGDAMVWKLAPRRKTFIDGRSNFFTPELLERFHKIRLALKDDDIKVWKPELDADKTSVVMIDFASSTNTYQKLMNSPNWIPFYDDGRVVMFGRTDAPAEDLAYFKANRLDAKQLAYHGKRPFVGFQRTPTATTWLDQIFQNRLFAKPQWRTEAARRWLFGGTRPDSTFTIPEPARCFLAIQEARTALSRDPDDWNAYRILATAYQFLTVQESALLSGIALTPENATRIASVSPNYRALMNRYRQRVTSLNFALQTTPPPRTTAARQEVLALNTELYQLFLSMNFFDLARDRLTTIVDLLKSDEKLPQDGRVFFAEQLQQLDQQVGQIEEAVKTIQIEQQANPVQQSMYALEQGGAGMAMLQLEEADRMAISPAVVKPQLIDLYCSTGQPDKAFELISNSQFNDPNLGSDPAAAALRQGVVHLLMGNYLSAITLWRERAIPSLRQERSFRVMNAAQQLLRGEAISVTDIDMAMPGSINQQANWEFDLAMCYLEAGSGDEAAASLTRALTLAPDMSMRPLAAYYLEQMGKPVPPPSKNAAVGAATSSASPAPATGLPGAPAVAPAPATPPAAAEPAPSASSPAPEPKKDTPKDKPKKP